MVDTDTAAGAIGETGAALNTDLTHTIGDSMIV